MQIVTTAGGEVLVTATPHKQTSALTLYVHQTIWLYYSQHTPRPCVVPHTHSLTLHTLLPVNNVETLLYELRIGRASSDVGHHALRGTRA